MSAASKSHGSWTVHDPWVWKPFMNCKGLGQWRVAWSQCLPKRHPGERKGPRLCRQNSSGSETLGPPCQVSASSSIK